jgi:4-hydroxyphenylacetate 3-monooxygenase
LSLCARQYLYLTYVIFNPQADCSKGAADQADPSDRRCRRKGRRGAKMLATDGVVAD